MGVSKLKQAASVLGILDICATVSEILEQMSYKKSEKSIFLTSEHIRGIEMKRVFILLALIVFLAGMVSLEAQDNVKEKIKGGYRKCVAIHTFYEHKTKNIKFKDTISRKIYDKGGNEIEVFTIYSHHGWMHWTTKYDSLERIIESTYYKEDNTISSKKTFIFNSNGKYKEVITSLDDGSIFNKVTYIYDDKGICIEHDEWHKSDSNSIVRSIFKYDSNNNLIETLIYDEDDSLYTESAIKYDGKGNKIEVIYFNENGSAYTSETYKYDQNRNIIEEVHFDSDGTLDEKYSYKFDNYGNEIERIEYNTNGSVREKLISKFDSEKNKLEDVYYKSDGSVDHKCTYKYDTKNEMIENVSFKSDGSVNYKTLYKYDDYGNILEKMGFYGLDEPDEKVEYIYSK